MTRLRPCIASYDMIVALGAFASGNGVQESQTDGRRSMDAHIHACNVASYIAMRACVCAHTCL